MRHVQRLGAFLLKSKSPRISDISIVEKMTVDGLDMLKMWVGIGKFLQSFGIDMFFSQQIGLP